MVQASLQQWNENYRKYVCANWDGNPNWFHLVPAINIICLNAQWFASQYLPVHSACHAKERHDARGSQRKWQPISRGSNHRGREQKWSKVKQTARYVTSRLFDFYRWYKKDLIHYMSWINTYEYRVNGLAKWKKLIWLAEFTKMLS